MILKIFKTLFIIIFCINITTKINADVFIKYKVNEEIITNTDIKNEKNYLIALNNQLQNLERKKITKIAENSIIREKIKKIELLKYYALGQENSLLNEVIKDFYLKLGLKNEAEFEEYLKPFNMTIKIVKKKIEIETTWNKLIFDKYREQIYVDIEKLKQNIELKKNTKNKKNYYLSEIVFEKKNNETVRETILKINNSIKKIGFKNTANTFSITNSAKFGGNVGWIEEAVLSDKIRSSLDNLKIGNLTKPISIGNNFIILKIEDIKLETKKINAKAELEKNIRFEQNRQLELFSKIYFDKVKINTYINEL